MIEVLEIDDLLSYLDESGQVREDFDEYTFDEQAFIVASWLDTGESTEAHAMVERYMLDETGMLHISTPEGTRDEHCMELIAEQFNTEITTWLRSIGGFEQ